MITRIKLLRNVGQFDSVTQGTNLPLKELTLVYAENGRGKTTLAAVLRSLATGDAMSIAERARLASTHPPHVIVEFDGLQPAMFQNNAWNHSTQNLVESRTLTPSGNSRFNFSRSNFSSILQSVK